MLTPAAFPPVGLIPLSLPLAATSVVVHVWREVALVVSLRRPRVRIPFSVAVSISAGIQASVPLAVSSVKCPQLGRAIVKAPTELQKPQKDTTIVKNSSKNLHASCVHTIRVQITFWSAQSRLHPVCVLVLFCLFRCWRSKLVIFCVGVFALVLDLCLDLCPGLCSGLGSCFDFLCPTMSGADCEASGEKFKVMSKQAITQRAKTEDM